MASGLVLAASTLAASASRWPSEARAAARSRWPCDSARTSADGRDNFHLVKAPRKTKNMSSSDEFLLKPTRENKKYL